MKEGIFCSKIFPMVYIGEMSDKKYTRTDSREATKSRVIFEAKMTAGTNAKNRPKGRDKKATGGGAHDHLGATEGRTTGF